MVGKLLACVRVGGVGGEHACVCVWGGVQTVTGNEGSKYGMTAACVDMAGGGEGGGRCAGWQGRGRKTRTSFRRGRS
eukprot:355447-Chlamydomonas_euryale.AAC.3